METHHCLHTIEQLTEPVHPSKCQVLYLQRLHPNYNIKSNRKQTTERNFETLKLNLKKNYEKYTFKGVLYFLLCNMQKVKV